MEAEYFYNFECRSFLLKKQGIMKKNFITHTFIFFFMLAACEKDNSNNNSAPGGGAPVASCNDGIQNQGETGIDCGGPCPPCPTCDDCIKNQGETGVDCGGPCPVTCAARMNCFIDGVDWIATNANAIKQISNFRVKGATPTTILEVILLTGNPSVGNYSLTIGNGTFTEPGDMFTINGGSLSFCSFDTINRLVSGSFSFTCSSFVSSNVKTISEGKFYNLMY
jgi:hypothetical protein